MPLPRTLLLLLLVVTVVTRVAGQRSACDEARLGGMQAQFGECTQRYKAEYRTAIEVIRNMICSSNSKIELQHSIYFVQDETADIAAVTCGLLDNMVTVCGEVWRQCHDLAQVIITRVTRDT